jgi:peroxiredoxin
MTRVFPLLFVLIFAPGNFRAADESPSNPEEGHSYHGEVFNEGPRQAAVLLPGTGAVHLAVTTSVSEAQQFFDQGLGQLHGFWDFEAERSFRQAAALDPDCAMAYWGMSLAAFANQTRAGLFAEEAKKHRDTADEREKMFIDALTTYFADPKKDLKLRLRELVRSWEKIIEAYPDEVEAKAILMKQLYYNNTKDLPYSSRIAIDLLIDQILAVNPQHPSHHYRIHLWDNTNASRSLASAAANGPAAPGVAHMWHMPGHTYDDLKRYRDSAWQQEASARIDHAHMMRFQIIPDQIHNYAHNNEWLVRNLNHLGRVEEATALAQNMISLPRIAKFEGKGKDEVYVPNGSWQLGRQRLRDTLLRYEQWELLIRCAEHSSQLAADEKVITADEWNRLLALAKCETGDRAGAAIHLAALEASLSAEQSKKDAAVSAAQTKATEAKKDSKATEEATKAAGATFAKNIEALEQTLREVRIYAALAASPPDLNKAKELLPDLKNVSKERHARLWERAGDRTQALTLAATAVKDGTNQVVPLAVQVELLAADGQTDAARTAFDQLRIVAGAADPDLPCLKRLAPLAASFSYPTDWRSPAPPTADLGSHPALDELGPALWTPSAAPDWTCADAAGKQISLADYRGRPLLLVLFLGQSCVHCMEQLTALDPLTESYEKAGISVVAISSEGLTLTPEAVDLFPFPLLADPGQSAFHAYRAYDDFEKQALHGIYFLDGEGRIRWQDISYQPFLKLEWLREECLRILKLEES